ncbi:hypothetical protein CHUAL_001936 [Chamberlinius hualienensis]
MKISCVICWEAIQLTSHPSVTKCGHMFHCDCLFQWLGNDQSCPQCRTEISREADLIKKIYFEIGPDAGLDDSSDMLKAKLKLLELKRYNAIVVNQEHMKKAVEAKWESEVKFLVLKEKIEHRCATAMKAKSETEAQYLMLEEKFLWTKSQLHAAKIALNDETTEKKALLQKLEDYETKAKRPEELLDETVKSFKLNESCELLKKQMNLLRTENTTLKLRMRSLNAELKRCKLVNLEDSLARY